MSSVIMSAPRKQISGKVPRETGVDLNVTHRSKPTRPLPENEQHSPSNRKIYTYNSENALATEIKQYMSELIHSEMSSIREAIGNLTNVITAQNTRIEQLEARVLALENNGKEQKPDIISSLQNSIMELQADISDRDQSLLANDIEISGCPETANENCLHLVVTVAKKLGVDIDVKDVVSAERAGRVRNSKAEESSSSGRPRSLVVRLTRRSSKDAMLHAARVRRGLNTEGMQLPGPISPLYLNERLTKLNRVLFQRARLIARDLKFKYVWTREGKIYVRQEHGSNRHQLRTESDLMRVFGKLNV